MRWQAELVLLIAVPIAALAFRTPLEHRGPAPGRDARIAGHVDFEQVRGLARSIARAPREEPAEAQLPTWLAQLNYDTYRKINFRREKALWTDPARPFRLEFFHRGYLFPDRVRIDEVVDGRARPVAFARDDFTYAKPPPGSLPDDLGFAGFRVLYPLNSKEALDEVASFLGASYFRALGRDLAYGASARGLAIGTGRLPQEEFPRFSHFWVQRPGHDSRSLSLLALLKSDRVSGAYALTISPGGCTEIDVQATIIARTSVEHIGIAPLTSMFLYGEAESPPPGDPRPEVHDSDGLLILAGDGTWHWRPLQNPQRVQITTFDLPAARGFGLLQRDRTFDHYRDSEAHYEKRPSIWVEVLGDWPAGNVELVELPSEREGYDNIAAMWTCVHPLPAGGELSLRYRLHFGSDGPHGNATGNAGATPFTASGAALVNLQAKVRTGGNGPPALHVAFPADERPLNRTWCDRWCVRN